MNLTSFFANKCFAYLLKCDSDRENGNYHTFQQQKSSKNSSSHITFSPPWSVSTDLFESLCNGCGDCVSHCENNILILKKNGCPGVDFANGACSFCGACAKNCPTGALRYEPEVSPWGLRAFITGKCLMKNRVLCSICVEQCDKEAIILAKVIHKDQSPEILAAECNGCGACFGSCPVGAIAFKDNEHYDKS